MRRTAITLRRLPPNARRIAQVANDLDTASRRLHRLAEATATGEEEQVANDARRVKLKGCAEHPDAWQSGCDGCYEVWATATGGVVGAREGERVTVDMTPTLQRVLDERAAS